MKWNMTGCRLILETFVVVLACTFSAAVSAQTVVRSISLEEAIDLSVKNSHQLHASQARIEQANARVEEAKDNFIPDVGVTGSYLRLNNPNVNMAMGNSGGGKDSTGAEIPAIHQAMYAIANASVPVFAGGKLRYGVESAKYLRQAALLDIQSDTQAVISNTVEAYTNLYKANTLVRLISQNLEQSRFRDSVLLRLENNGLLARNDRLKAQLQTSNIELSLLDAQSNAKIAMMNMDLMLGLPATTGIITDSTGFELTGQLLPLSSLEQISLTNRKDLLALQQRESAAETGIKLAHADYYPTLGVTAGYAALSIPKVLTVTNAVNVGVGLKYNLSSLWKTRPKIEEANARYRELTENEAQLKDAITLQVNKSFENFMLQQKKISVFESAVIQAEENARITKNKFDNQLLNTTDLLDANVALLQSQINLAVAKADLYMDYVKVLETSGILMK